MPGLQLRVRGKARTWKYRTRFGGKWLRVTLGQLANMSLADAREEVRKLAGFVDQGIDPRAAQARIRRRGPTLRAVPAMTTAANAHSIENLAKEFMERFIRPRRKRPEVVQHMLDRDVLPVWKGRDARTIEPHEVIQLLDGIVDRGAPVQANRVAAVLSQLFRFGIHRTIVKASPVQLLYKPGGKETPRDRVLSEEELRVLLRDPQECTRFEKMAHVIMILLLTGQRRGELANAKWDHVDFAKNTWTIPSEHSKNGKPHVVPLSAWAVREFEALHRGREGSDFVLPGANGLAHDAKLLTRALARCQKRFKARGVAAFTLHDLRRTCRTGLAKLKVPPHIAERVVNHTQDAMVMVYDLHEYIDEKRDALEKWSMHLESLRAAR